VAELGLGTEGLIPLWFGEGAWPTHPSIVEAAVAALRAGNHRYQPNNSARALRTALADYGNRLFGAGLTDERITVTPSGMQGIMLVAQLLVTPGDRVVTLSPGWPNIAGAFTTQGAVIETVALAARDGRWTLDLDLLLARIGTDARAVVINSPNNPTGWTMAQDDQRRLLDHCRRHDIWIVADDVYARLYRHGDAAPSFLSFAGPEDLLISVNSFSKCWSMTGWRLGWLVAPVALETRLGQLTEFNSSCTAGFVQEAGITALREGEAEISDLRRRIAAGYDIAARHLSACERVEFIEPDGAFYCFFRVEGMADSFEACKTILRDTRVGLAPGIAFGPEGEGWLRLCHAQPVAVLDQAFARLSPFLNR